MFVVYLLLASLAAIFLAAGFLIHAFFFAHTRVHALSGEVEKLQKLLGEKQNEVSEAQEEIAKTSAFVRSMEQRIRRRHQELDGLQQVAARQDKEIAELQRDAEAIRLALAASGSLGLSPAVRPEAVTGRGRGPEWRNNLDQILESLDKIGNAGETDS